MSVGLVEYHKAVEKWMLNKVDWLRSFTPYPEEKTALVTPLAFFQIEDFELAETQSMDGQLSVDLQCEIVIIYGIDSPEKQLGVRWAAMEVAKAVHGCRFGLACYEAQVLSAGPDPFFEEEGYAVWSVKYSQRVEIGEDEFAPNPHDVTPHTVYVGQCPDVGAQNIEDYQQVVPAMGAQPRNE